VSRLRRVVQALLMQCRDYVFFFSYIQVNPKEGEALWSNAEEMCRVNSELPSLSS
jgi:hypothetical protein